MSHYYNIIVYIAPWLCPSPPTAFCGSIRQHTSAYVSIRQHTSAYVLHRRLLFAGVQRQYLYFCTSKASKLSTYTAAAYPMCTWTLVYTILSTKRHCLSRFHASGVCLLELVEYTNKISTTNISTTNIRIIAPLEGAAARQSCFGLSRCHAAPQASVYVLLY